MKNLTRSCTRLTLTSQQKLGDGGAQHESADFLGLGMPMPLLRGIALRYKQNKSARPGELHDRLESEEGAPLHRMPQVPGARARPSGHGWYRAGRQERRTLTLQDLLTY